MCGEVGRRGRRIFAKSRRTGRTWPGQSAVESGAHHGLIERLKANNTPCSKFWPPSTTTIRLWPARTFLAGADGCVHMGEPVARIIEAIRTVLRGEMYVGNRMAKCLVDRAVEGKSLDGNPAELLSHRELDVFAMIGQGMTTQQIARKLDLSPRTIETHRKNIKMKLELQNGVQLSRCAFAWVRDNA